MSGPDHKSAWVQAEHLTSCGWDPKASVPNLAHCYLEAITLLGRMMVQTVTSEEWANAVARAHVILREVGK